MELAASPKARIGAANNAILVMRRLPGGGGGASNNVVRRSGLSRAEKIADAAEYRTPQGGAELSGGEREEDLDG